MSQLKSIVILLFLLYGCSENNPPKYLEAKVLEASCKPIVQIKGSDIGDQWRGFENVVVINNPDADGITIPSDSVFYFRSYELTSFNPCINPDYAIGFWN